jgi:hypothetical protein
MSVDIERIHSIVFRSGRTVSEITLDMICDIVWQFDIYEEIQAALSGEASKFTEEVAEALSFTEPDPPIGMFDSDYDR